MSTPRPRPWRPVTTVVLAVLALGLLGVRVDAAPRTRLAPAPAAASPSPVGHGPAAGAVTALVTAPPGQDPLASVPPDFASVMGYTPVPTRMADGTLRLAKPTGACSVPGGGAPFGFRRACQVHDYGYDLLRYAHATGQHLTAEARRQLDAMFRHDLRAGRQAAGQGLGGAARDLVVELFATGVAFNSWRQHYGNPAREPLAGLALGLAAPVLAVAIHPRLLRRRGRDGAGQHGGSVTPVTAGVRWRRHARGRRVTTQHPACRGGTDMATKDKQALDDRGLIRSQMVLESGLIAFGALSIPLFQVSGVLDGQTATAAFAAATGVIGAGAAMLPTGAAAGASARILRSLPDDSEVADGQRRAGNGQPDRHLVLTGPEATKPAQGGQ